MLLIFLNYLADFLMRIFYNFSIFLNCSFKYKDTPSTHLLILTRLQYVVGITGIFILIVPTYAVRMCTEVRPDNVQYLKKKHT